MDPRPAAPSRPSAADALSDARRGVYYVKPMLRGWLHLLWFAASLVAGTLLVARAHGAVRITALAIYAASVSAMFGISALYHRGTWTAGWNRRLQRLDHAMIFVLIAGTATPAFLLATSGTFRLACLIMMWALTAAAAALRLAWMSAPELVAGSTFVGLGRRARAAGRVDPCRGRGGRLDALGRAAVHRRGAGLPPAPARPLPGRVRLPRGLPRLRLCRCGV